MLSALLISGSLPAMAAGERLSNLGDSASDELSPVQERKLGEEIMRQARAEDAVFADPESTECLNRFGEVLLRQHDRKGAEKQTDLAEKGLKEPCELIASQRIAIALADDDSERAVKLAKAAHSAFPQSRALIAHYAKALQAAGNCDQGIASLHDQLALYPSQALLYELLARDYASKREPMLERRAMAENYYLRGSLSAAVEQL